MPPTTTHTLITGDARSLASLPDGSIHCVVTSPPYPMIEMWDEIFSTLSPAVAQALANNDATAACEAMHVELDKVWAELYRVMTDGGIACINIGDATRTIGGNFQIHMNHARILQGCLGIGFQALPAIIWRKQTNAPNKFMGSGMLPPGAYVTLEHEYILVLRKGTKRTFTTAEQKQQRRQSAFFWEERNQWFSDVWTDLKGSRQELGGELRARSGAFPFELAYRLISMYSVQGDTILDPFMGTGTTALAALAAQRNSIGSELDAELNTMARQSLATALPWANELLAARLARHHTFVQEREKPFKHHNVPHDTPCISAQEHSLTIREITTIDTQADPITASYGEPLQNGTFRLVP